MVKVASGPRIVVDKEFAALIPKIGADELELLDANIKAEGCIDPLVVWEVDGDHILLDGHNRLKICRKHDKAFSIHRMKLQDRNAALDWVINHQLGRRNISDEQRRYLLGKLWKEADKSPGALKQGEKNPRSAKLSERENTAKTAKEIAANHDVSEREVYRAAEFAEAVDAIGEKSPELKDAILAGDVRASASDLEALAEAPKRTVERVARQVEKADDAKAAKAAVKAAMAEREPGDDTDLIASQRKASRNNGRPVVDARKVAAFKTLMGRVVRLATDLGVEPECREHFKAIDRIVKGKPE